jgi:WXG100 family type VII secretion target
MGSPGGTTFTVTPEYVLGAANSCDSTAGQIQTQLATLKSYVVSLEAMWKGIAADAFNKLMTDYDIYAQMLHNALVDIASGLRGNYVNYKDTEQQNINNIVAVNGNIPGSYLENPASNPA